MCICRISGGTVAGGNKTNITALEKENGRKQEVSRGMFKVDKVKPIDTSFCQWRPSGSPHFIGYWGDSLPGHQEWAGELQKLLKMLLVTGSHSKTDVHKLWAWPMKMLLLPLWGGKVWHLSNDFPPSHWRSESSHSNYLIWVMLSTLWSLSKPVKTCPDRQGRPLSFT